MGTSVYWDVPAFLFFGHKDVSDFLEFHLKLFFFSTTPSIPKFRGPLYLEALGNDLIGLVEGLILHIDLIPSQSEWAWTVNFDYLEKKMVDIIKQFFSLLQIYLFC